ncbi:MAG: mechanosensitive ion channel family protein [Bacilli bacterium]|nr:mechanosensitive ion channel family protein [Bacilli bacterium]
MKNWKYHESFETSKKHIRKRTTITAIITAIGILLTSVATGLFQFKNTKEASAAAGNDILDETSTLIKSNTVRVDTAQESYFDLAQHIVTTTIPSLAMTGTDDLLAMIPTADPDDLLLKEEEVSANFASLPSAGSGFISFLINKEGTIYASGQDGAIGKSIKEYLLLPDSLSSLVAYNIDPETESFTNGTMTTYPEGTEIIDPVSFVVDGNIYFGFSSSYVELLGERYFYCIIQRSGWIFDQIFELFVVGNTLKEAQVPNGGFTFAVSKDLDYTFYLEMDGKDYTGTRPEDLGFGKEVYENSFKGFQTINGQTFYVVTTTIDTELQGRVTIGVATVKQETLVYQGISNTIFAAIVFTIIVGIYCSYGLLLRRDVAKYTFDLRSSYTKTMREEVVAGNFKYTDEEIEERADIYIDTLVSEGKDKKLGRINIGVRDSKGTQRYFLKIFSKKMVPIACFGLIGIFAITYFANTLHRMEDITITSNSRLESQNSLIEQRYNQSFQVSSIMESSQLARADFTAKNFGYIPEYITGGSTVLDDQIHPLYKTKQDGTKEPVLDEYGHQRYSVSENSYLAGYANENDMFLISLFDINGLCMSTNGSLWAENVYSDIEANKEIIQVLNGEVDNNISYVGYAGISISAAFNYYTFDDGDKTLYVSSASYKDQIEGTWMGPEITKHRGAIRYQAHSSVGSPSLKPSDIYDFFGGAKVYGEGSFFMAFAKDEARTILYCPRSEVQNSPASILGFNLDSYFSSQGFSGFQRLNGVGYYHTVMPFDTYFLAAIVPTTTVFSSWSAAPLALSLISFVIMGVLFLYSSFSSDKEDQDYQTVLQGKNEVVSPDRRPFFKTRRVFVRPTTVRLTQWQLKTPDEKISVLTSFGLGFIALAALITTVISLSVNDGSDIFTYIFSHKWERGFNIFSVTESLIAMTAIIISTRLLFVIVHFLTANVNSRLRTIGDLVISTIRYGGIIAGIFYCLYLFGVNTQALVTSATIISLVVGLGAQPLIGDLIAGIFIVFEGSMEVGDIVNIGGNRGKVLEIGLRTTKISEYGNIRIYNNSDIKNLLNLSKEDSYAAVEFSISYDEDLPKVESLLKGFLPEIGHKIPEILEGPWYSGIYELADSSVDLRVVCKVDEENIWYVKRALKRELYLFCLKNNIQVPYNHITLDLDPSVKDSVSEIKKAIEEKKGGDDK